MKGKPMTINEKRTGTYQAENKSTKNKKQIEPKYITKTLDT